MRALGWSLTTLLAAAPALFAQQPARPAQAPPLNVPGNDPLPLLLQQWEQQMKSIRAIDATVKRTQTDKIDGTTTVYMGTAKLLRPDRADLYLIKQTNPPQANPPQQYERFLLTGNFLYEFVPKQQLIRIHQLPQKAPGQPAIDDNFLGLLFGMSALEAQRRYDLRVVPKPEDKHYHYVEVTPRMTSDRAEFIKARLVLWQNSFLPRQIEFVEPNGNPILWDVLKIDANARLGPADFQTPKLPAGWKSKVEPAPAGPQPGAPGAPPPTTVRPSGKI
jgi:TIGR03009 family protein